MKMILLSALLSLLCVGWAEATVSYLDEPTTAKCPQYSHCFTVPPGDKSYMFIDTEQFACLAKMEAAMKAANLLVAPNAVTFAEIKTMYPYEGGKYQRYTIQQMLPEKEYFTIVELWTAAKTDCWQSGR